MTKPVSAIFFSTVVGLFLLSACKSTQPVNIREYPQKTSAELTSLIEHSRLDYEQFSAKAAVDVQTPEQSNSFKATLRVRKDSAIWISVSPAMGIEVFRLLCTQDSVLYIDKLKKEYFRGTYQKLNDITNSDLNLEALQDLLVGDPLYFEPDLEYRSKNEEMGYRLSTKNTRRLRRVVGSDKHESVTIPLDTTGSELNEKKLSRLQDKMDDEELIIRQYWLDYSHGKISQSVFTNLATALSLSAVYSEFESMDGQWIPSNIFLELGNTKDHATFKLDYSRIKLNATFEMPFSIPDKYEEVRQ